MNYPRTRPLTEKMTHFAALCELGPFGFDHLVTSGAAADSHTTVPGGPSVHV